jgi:hypothetical protein
MWVGMWVGVLWLAVCSALNAVLLLLFSLTASSFLLLWVREDKRAICPRALGLDRGCAAFFISIGK